ncbi:cupin domain-containing protein [Mitsuaria sp. CC2]|uniref:JmjC domain-containing protein n=1 Tax=Mitsuaria sp. CC2 TaxID=3029186 RepID=UPI003B8E361C
MKQKDVTMLSLGITRPEFLREYRESTYLFVRGGAVGVPGLKEADVFLDHSDPMPPHVRLFRDGPVPEPDYLETFQDAGMARRRLVKDRLYDLLNDGATMVLNRIDVRSRPIRQLCREVAQLTGDVATANAYLAVSGAGSFKEHWDTHDVFAVQLEGRKRWRLYGPTWELPLRHQTSLAHKAECPDAPVFDEILEQGDVLYIPRGWWHRADPIGELTFHAAIGVHVTPMLDYFTWACQRSLTQSREARTGLRLDEDQAPAAAAEAMIKQLATFLRDDRHWHEFRQTMQAQQRNSLPFSIGEHVPAAPVTVDLDAPLRLNSHHRSPDFINGFRVVSEGWGRDIMRTLDVEGGSTPRRILAALPEVDADTGMCILAELLRREVIERI